jgi:hypothetical protein
LLLCFVIENSNRFLLVLLFKSTQRQSLVNKNAVAKICTTFCTFTLFFLNNKMIELLVLHGGTHSLHIRGEALTAVYFISRLW